MNKITPVTINWGIDLILKVLKSLPVTVISWFCV